MKVGNHQRKQAGFLALLLTCSCCMWSGDAVVVNADGTTQFNGTISIPAGTAPENAVRKDQLDARINDLAVRLGLLTHSAQFYRGSTTWVVPPNVTLIYVEVRGGGGGGGGGASGYFTDNQQASYALQAGGGASGSLWRGCAAVKPGETVNILVGGGGGGGVAGAYAGGGGGGGGSSGMWSISGLNILALGGLGGISATNCTSAEYASHTISYWVDDPEWGGYQVTETDWGAIAAIHPRGQGGAIGAAGTSGGGGSGGSAGAGYVTSNAVTPMGAYDQTKITLTAGDPQALGGASGRIGINGGSGGDGFIRIRWYQP